MSATPAPEVPRNAASVHLDAVRGLAALAVVIYHIRYKFFLDYSEVPHTLTSLGFYTATSFGHDAVMVFFVLSGYLISGTVLKDLRRGRWSWPRYAFNRLTRLYVVLIPGLLLTLFWDRLGLHLFPLHPAYTGAPTGWKHDFFPVADSLSAGIAVANLFFQHAIAGIPPLGSNIPLWSLTYEVAYYLVFPAAMVAIWPSSRVWMRMSGAALAALASYHFGSRIMLYFPIWLFGFSLHLLPQMTWLRRVPSLWRTVAVALFVVGCTCARHTPLGGSLETGDYIVGVAFAIGLYVLLHDTRPIGDRGYSWWATALSQISYTLYVVHMPVLIFLRAAINPGPSWSPSPATMLAEAALTVAMVGYAVAVWFVAERQTDRIRAAIGARSPLAALRRAG